MAIERKTRALFQVHLSTALVLMFVAGGLIWVNVFARTTVGTDPDYTQNNALRYVCAKYGWPFTAFTSMTSELVSSTFHRPEYDNSFYFWRTTLNIVFGVFVLAVLGIVCEWWIRQREKDRSKP